MPWYKTVSKKSVSFSDISAVNFIGGHVSLLVPFIRCQLSVVVNFSFSYNTLFLSSLGFMAAQYTPSGV